MDENEEVTKYPELKSFLNNEFNCFPDERELENIINQARISDTHSQNVGFQTERLQFDVREQAFHDHWLHVNTPQRGINYGHGILQDLFIVAEKGSTGLFGNTICHTEINKRDRMIVATVIQWLGTNCGMAFLQEVFEKFGYRVIRIKQKE